MSSRTRLSFDVKLNTTGQTIKVAIADPSKIQADNLALATWGSSEVLANILHRLPIDFSSTGVLNSSFPVLELGAGTGLVGISAACIWRTNAILTDLPPIIPNIEANIELNRELLRQQCGIAVCGTLDWANPKCLLLGKQSPEEAPQTDEQNVYKRARVIVAADTVYDEDHPELLVSAVKARLDIKLEARLIMCYPLRIGYLDHIRDLWARLEGAGLVCIQEGRESIDESWEEDVPYEWCVWRWQDVAVI